MASSSRSARTIKLQAQNKWKDGETSPDRTVVWTEPLNKSPHKVPVVYYLSSNNGQLQHPHFIQVPVTSSHGLYLRDVINRLNILRGNGMASMYSWSCKRSYKNGYVWHDLEENDFIYPAHGQEYVLKGTEYYESGFISKPDETVAKKSLPENEMYGGELDSPAVTRRRNQSWSSFDVNEYNVYKTDPTGGLNAADASTQTDDKRRRRRAVRVVEEEIEEAEEQKREEVIHSTELSKDEIPPPPSDSSPETLETLLKADGRMIQRPETVNEIQPAVTGKSKTTSVLMQLISCGSMSFKDCGPSYVKEHGLSLISHYKTRLPRGGGSNNAVEKDAGIVTVEKMKGNSSNNVMLLEDKEYFSGSLILETKKTEYPALKRSSSYNVDRSSHMELMDKEMEGVKAKCIPRKIKATKKEGRSSSDISCNDSSSVSCNSSQHGSSK